jgi:hypothetical protein
MMVSIALTSVSFLRLPISSAAMMVIALASPIPLKFESSAIDALASLFRSLSYMVENAFAQLNSRFCSAS